MEGLQPADLVAAEGEDLGEDEGDGSRAAAGALECSWSGECVTGRHLPPGLLCQPHPRREGPWHTLAERDGRSARSPTVLVFHISDGEVTETWSHHYDQHEFDEFWA